jgi:hypothetical protein
MSQANLHGKYVEIPRVVSSVGMYSLFSVTWEWQVMVAPMSTLDRWISKIKEPVLTPNQQFSKNHTTGF